MSPVTRLGKNLGQLFEIHLVFVVESQGFGTVDVDNRDSLFTNQHIPIACQNLDGYCPHLSPYNNRHNNLTPALRITGNMARELKYIRHHNRLLCCSRSPTNTLPESNLLTSRFPVERAQQQKLVLGGGVCCRDDYSGANGSGRRNW